MGPGRDGDATRARRRGDRRATAMRQADNRRATGPGRVGDCGWAGGRLKRDAGARAMGSRWGGREHCSQAMTQAGGCRKGWVDRTPLPEREGSGVGARVCALHRSHPELRAASAASSRTGRKPTPSPSLSGRGTRGQSRVVPFRNTTSAMRLSGASMPCFAPSRAITPLRASASVGRPARRSAWIELIESAGPLR